EDLIQPGLVCLVPANGLCKSPLEIPGRRPTQLIFQFSAIQGVATIMRRTVYHKLEQTLGTIKRPENFAGHGDVLQFALAADVVNFALTPLMQNQVECAAMVFHMN